MTIVRANPPRHRRVLTEEQPVETPVGEPSRGGNLRRPFVLIATAFVLCAAVQTADAMICVAGDAITLRRVQGIVVAETEEGLDGLLPGVVVEITGGDLTAGTVTDEDGYFTFGELRPGNYEIQANLEGFGPIRDTIRVRSQGASEGACSSSRCRSVSIPAAASEPRRSMRRGGCSVR